MMRIATSIGLILAGTLAALATSAAQAADNGFRPATKVEIIKHLSGASQLKEAANGYSYKTGGTTGYKISNGKICVLAKGRSVDCVTVSTDGTTFQMIDRTGTREKF